MRSGWLPPVTQPILIELLKGENYSLAHTQKKKNCHLIKLKLKKKKKPYEGVKNLYSDYVIQNGWLPRKFENKFHIENPNKSQLKHKLNLPNV